MPWRWPRSAAHCEVRSKLHICVGGTGSVSIDGYARGSLKRLSMVRAIRTVHPAKTAGNGWICGLIPGPPRLRVCLEPDRRLRVDQLWLARGHASEHRVPCGHGDLLGGEVGQAVPAVTAAQVKDPWPIGMLDPHDFVVGAELAPEGERGPVELQVAFRPADCWSTAYRRYHEGCGSQDPRRRSRTRVRRRSTAAGRGSRRDP